MDVVQVLRRNGASSERVDRHGATIIHAAAGGESVAMLGEVKSWSGVSLHATTHQLANAAHVAAENGQYQKPSYQNKRTQFESKPWTPK